MVVRVRRCTHKYKHTRIERERAGERETEKEEEGGAVREGERETKKEEEEGGAVTRRSEEWNAVTVKPTTINES